MRIPISRVRRATKNAITPYKPAAARTVASTPKEMDRAAARRSTASESSFCFSTLFIWYTGSCVQPANRPTQLRKHLPGACGVRT